MNDMFANPAVTISTNMKDAIPKNDFQSNHQPDKEGVDHPFYLDRQQINPISRDYRAPELKQNAQRPCGRSKSLNAAYIGMNQKDGRDEQWSNHSDNFSNKVREDQKDASDEQWSTGFAPTRSLDKNFSAKLVRI